MITNKWRGHPDRPCREDDRYADLLVTRGPGAREVRIAMAHACLACPVYLECLQDVLEQGKEWTFYGIQAGKIGRT